ncbi:hypothetical protein [Natronorubrum thiooxidans]|uniref:Uncharacterized protein n=1 Tax=Natronorubrum thiooxidans TaxID=308853 RepID=A0A1N7H7Y1_9EURY|nr:hypothetical protein [Natronorubrum thiooxidans]SIS20883.1 hypothetical protein SAMN05421752_1305 [Natronorubrum thiooxidans]
MAGNDDLHEVLLKNQEAVGKVEQAVTSLKGVVEQVRDAIVEGTTEIREAIHENIRAQAELKLMEHMMEVRSVKPQLEAEHERMSAERSELQDRLENIEERYQRKHEELDEMAGERIRDLGSHIFEINEQEFEEGVEEPFTQQVTSAWHVLQAHNETVREEREGRLRETTDEMAQHITDYVDRHEELIESIDEHRFDPDDVPVDGDGTEPLQLPYYVVEYEVDGVSQRTTVVPSRLSSDDGTEWCPVSLSPLPGIEDLISDSRELDTTNTESSLSLETLQSTASTHGESSLLGLSYEDAVMAAIPDDGHIPVRTEGGDN